jgi:hypothetical protein
MIATYPLEQARVNCDPAEISGFFDRLERHVEGLPSAFVFNFDESGCQDWADRRKRTVSVPGTDQKSEIAYSVDRATKRSSSLVCIAADRQFLHKESTNPYAKWSIKSMDSFPWPYLKKRAGIYFCGT